MPGPAVWEPVDPESGLHRGCGAIDVLHLWPRGPYVESGDFKALAFLSDEPLDDSDTPTWKELTGESFPIGKMFGYWFPKDTDPAIVDKFNAAVEKCVNSQEFKAHCDQYFVTPVYRGGEEAVAYLDEQYVLMTDYKDALLVQ